jgi:TetR/AcrR family transcriptional regulator, tetracycline repressor protein
VGSARTRGQRAGLTREAVLAAARTVIAEQGLPAMTMRTLAGRLGVTPNALYNHAASKDALVDDLLDDVLRDVEPPDQHGPDPAGALQTLLTATYDALVDCPDLVPLFLTRQRRNGPNAQRLSAGTLALLARAGLGPADAAQALRALVVFTFGFAAVAGRPTLDPGGDRPLTADQLRANFRHGLRWLIIGAGAGEGADPGLAG